LPGTLEEALAALRTNVCFSAGFGDRFVDYYVHIKEAEIARAARRRWTNRSRLTLPNGNTGIFRSILS